MDEKLSVLIDLFPSDDFEDLLMQLEASDCDLENTINFIISQKNTPTDPFNHLIKTFPDIEVEAIEAFLLTTSYDSEFEDMDHQDHEEITQMFMKQQSHKHDYSREMIPFSPVRRQKEKDLKLSLSEFQTVFSDKNKHKHINNNNVCWSKTSSSHQSSVFQNDNSLNFKFTCKPPIRNHHFYLHVYLFSFRIDRFGRLPLFIRSDRLASS